MTPADIQRLAERAREHHLQAYGLSPRTWHETDDMSKRAWISTTELIVSETCRRLQLERLEITDGGRDGHHK
jgi:hypothetical protein